MIEAARLVDSQYVVDWLASWLSFSLLWPRVGLTVAVNPGVCFFRILVPLLARTHMHIIASPIFVDFGCTSCWSASKVHRGDAPRRQPAAARYFVSIWCIVAHICVYYIFVYICKCCIYIYIYIYIMCIYMYIYVCTYVLLVVGICLMYCW